MSKHAYVQTRYLVQLAIVFIWTISLLISDPLNYHGKQLQRQGLVPTTLWLTRLKDPLKDKIAWHAPASVDMSMPRFTLVGWDLEPTFDSTVYNFLTEHTFTEEEDFPTFERISKNHMSPHTRAMVIMGCYGDPFDIPEMKNPDVYKMAHNASTAFMLNIMLQTWEDTYNNHDRKQAGVGEIAKISNDRSVCSCMKDFATPALMKSIPAKGGVQRYAYDSCLLQNLVDYPATHDIRQRVDPMKFELQEYTKLLIAYYKNDNSTSSTATWESVSIVEAMKSHPEINQLISIIGNTSVSNLKGLMDHLDARINGMYPHNKLRTPKAHNNPIDSDKDLSSYPPIVSKESFALYMTKYRSSFQVCAHNGIPQYQTKQLVLLAATKFSKLGMSFLLGAAIIGFSVLYKKMQGEDKKVSGQSGATDIKNKGFEWAIAFFELTTRAAIIVSLAMTLLSISQDLRADTAAEKMTILTFTTAVWWVFALVLLGNFVSETYYLTKDQGEEEKTHVRSQISQDVCVIGGLANVGVSLLLHRGESDEYVVTACFVLFLTIGLIQHCSNLVRMMQLYTARMLNVTKETTTANIGIAYNRVLVLVLVAVGLLGYVMLASSSLQIWTADVLYGYQRVRIFAICAFLILSTFDIFFEVLVQMKYGAVAPFKDQHPRKMMWTGWVIIVSLLILHVHQYSSLCMSRDPKASEDICNIVHYFFRIESTTSS